eukprot:16430956-Heterocapsa_arctica.AAC.1
MAYNCGYGEWKDGTRYEQIKTSMIHTAENTSAANDAVFQFVLPGMLKDMGLDLGFADSELENRLHDSLKDAGCFRHALPRLGVT